MKKVKIGFYGLSPAAKVVKGRHIIGMMTGNPYFPIPTPSMTMLGLATDGLEQAIEDSMDGGHSLIATRNLREKALVQQFTLLGAYVQTASGGDEEKIRSSGFGIVGDPSPVGVLPAPENVRIRYNLAQQLVLLWSGVKGRKAYKVEMCTADPAVEANWLRVQETGKIRLVVPSLVVGTMVWLRVRTMYVTGFSNPSEPAEGLVLVSQ